MKPLLAATLVSAAALVVFGTALAIRLAPSEARPALVHPSLPMPPWPPRIASQPPAEFGHSPTATAPRPGHSPTPDPARVASPEVIPALVVTPSGEPGKLGGPALVVPARQGPRDAFGRPPAPLIDPRRFTEAHWQGLEVVPKTQALAKALRIPAEVEGVIVDDVTLPADLQGFQAGDVVMSVGQVATPTLMDFVQATARVRERRRAGVEVWRAGGAQSLVLTALLSRLGTANGETPSMIPPGSRMPHRYRGPCTNCHRIGTTGQLAVDPGDLTATTVPAIRASAMRPHRDFGPCNACHQIRP